MSKKREREIRLRAILPVLPAAACLLPIGMIGRAFASLAIVGHVLGCIFTENMVRQGFAAATWPWLGFTFGTFVVEPRADDNGWHVRCQVGDKPSIYLKTDLQGDFIR